MKLFDIFKRQKKMTIKELFAPVLDKMWMCVINFKPWDTSRYEVVFKEVNIIKASAIEEGILVESNECDPFDCARPASTNCTRQFCRMFRRK